MLFLENAWSPEPAPFGTLELALHNLGETDLEGFTLSITSITRVMREHHCYNGRLLRRAANFHEFAMPEGAKLAAGAVWRFQIEGISRAPNHRNDAAKSAWITRDGRHTEVQLGDLMLGHKAPQLPPPRLPEGRLTLPFALTPWPNRIEAEAGPPPAILHLEAANAAEKRLALEVDAHHRRLFPAKARMIQLSPVPGSKAVRMVHDAQLPPEAYRLNFGPEITLSASTPAGQRYALLSLVQMLHGAYSYEKFKFPSRGFIEDAPRYGWRGCHLDVSRHFWSLEEVKRVVDILGWYKLNIFHWHLTDDEGWRAEIKAYPALTDMGAHRAYETDAMLPQLANGAAREGGFYTQDEMRALVAHADRLGIEVMPEIETPGHAACVMAALPHLADGRETPDSYHSVQGYPNNAFNPAMPESYKVLEQIIEELCQIFPSRYFHIGGDEVAKNAWLESPEARNLMQREGISGTFELQSWFLAHIKKMLDARGKVLVGWNEVALGGGVPPKDTLLMAWEKPEVGIELAEMGYDVVMTPGQAYYLDMVQGPDWLENGASWAGVVPPTQTYAYEAEGDFPPHLQHHMRGIQACIWCEHYTTPHWFNDLVFPRLPAVAEAGWTQSAQKDWLRFAALARLHPIL